MSNNPLLTNSPAKKMVIEFLRVADNAELVFIVPGDEATAERFVSHMRVELSRLRKTLIDQGTTPRRFRMRKKSIEAGEILDDGTPTYKITLQKDASSEQLVENIASVLKDLASPISQ